jgi:hypothetical protein
MPSEISDGMNQLISESQFDSGSESKVYALWTETQHAVIVAQKKVNKTATKTNINYAITYVPIDGNPNNINPLGMLPFVYLQKGDSVDYPVSNPLASQTINYNVLNSDLLTASSMQGFGQAVLKYPAGSEITELEISYMTAIKLPQSTELDAKPTEFEYVNASPNLEGQLKVNNNYLKQILSEQGINSAQAISGETEQFNSGLDRMIAQADVQWLIQENQEMYLDLENEAFEIIKAWESLKGNNEFDQYDEIKVIYEKPTVQISDTEKLNNIKMLLDLGLKSRAQALQILDPNLSDEQAELEISEVDQPILDAARQVTENQPAQLEEPPQDTNEDITVG